MTLHHKLCQYVQQFFQPVALLLDLNTKKKLRKLKNVYWILTVGTYIISGSTIIFIFGLYGYMKSWNKGTLQKVKPLVLVKCKF